MAAKRGKSQARRSGGNSNNIPGWAWLVLGVLLTVVVIIVAPKYLKSDGDGFFRPQPNPDAQPAPVAEEEDAVAPEGDVPAPKTTKSADKEGEDYDFYTLLPGKEVPLSDAEIAATERAEAQREAARAKEAQQTQQQAQTDAAASDPAVASLPKPVDTASSDAGTGNGDTAAISRPKPAVASPATDKTAATADNAAAKSSNIATAKPAAAKPAPATTAPAAAIVDDNARYLLQAGAFQASGQAEELKARIALLGLGARVEAAQIKGATVYRVRMGPYGTASDLADAKRKLSAGGLQAMAIKVK